jgi:hypothetical protein
MHRTRVAITDGETEATELLDHLAQEDRALEATGAEAPAQLP